MDPKKEVVDLIRISLILLLSILTFTIHAQSKGALKGKVIDQENGSELPGATIAIKGSSYGTVSDIYGDYYLPLDAGSHTLEVRYLGYKEVTLEVEIQAKEVRQQDFLMEADAFLVSEVVITAQLQGQQAAINQQIKANSIVNIVSKDRIEALPDQNAAESVGRLSGISIRREGGEGQQVVVRGMSPRFNSITINGERIPSSDALDRSFDLSTLSADALQGIEVYKSWTPNLEGDAIGGTVNFVTKKASAGWHGKVRYLHGYNGQQDELGQHRANVDIGNRFFENKIGVLVSGNFQRADRSQDRLNRDFVVFTADDSNQGNEGLLINNIDLIDRIETRDRYGGTLSLDYTFDRGEIRLFSNYSQTDRDQVQIRRRFRFGTRRQEYLLEARKTENSLLANTLSGAYNIANKLDLSWSSSYSKTTIRTPFDNNVRFRENSAFDEITVELPTEQQILEAAQNDLDQTFFQRAISDEDNIDFERLTGQIDLAYPIDLGNNITGKIKIGGKFRSDNRIRDIRRFQARADQLQAIAQARPDDYIIADDQILIESFLGNFEAEDFLDGDYYLGPGSGLVNGGHLDADALRDFQDENIAFYERDVFVDGSDYEADEQITAGYLMIDFKIGDKLNVLAGVRNETTDLDYTGFQVSGSATSSEIDIGDDPRLFLLDSAVSRSYTEWLPSVNVKYNLSSWMDVRAAVTKTLSRPSFLNMVPFVRIDLDNSEIQRGNFNLQHQVSLNYDLFISAYNKFGLFTIGGFYKEIDDVDFVRRSLVTPITPNTTENLIGFTLIQPENSLRTSTVKGIELDAQVNFASLPSPWNGIILSANATFIESTTFFPRVLIVPNPTRPANLDREGTLPGQPDEVYNVSLGYEKGGFSGRISVIHQANTFGFPDQAGERLGGLDAELDLDSQLDAFTRRTTRVDMSIKQRVYKNTMVFFNANNITNQEEAEFNGDGLETSRRVFGPTLDLGIQYKF